MTGDAIPQNRAHFLTMESGSPDDWQAIVRASEAERGRHVERIIDQLKLLHDDHGGFPVDRLEHSLQTATRAHRDGRDEEYVVCALLHDIGDTLVPADHAELGATILKPYVSEANHWILRKHGIFQGYYFFHHLGLDRDMREKYRGHPYFEQCVDFCYLYDQNSFDGGYDSLPLDAFVPMMRRVMETPKRSIYMLE